MAHQTHLVGGGVDGEVLLVAQALDVAFQDAHAQRVESGEYDSLRFLAPHQVLDPLLRRVLETGVPLFDYEITGPLSTTGEDECDYMITCSRVETEGTVVGVQLVVQDISERKAAERAKASADAAQQQATSANGYVSAVLEELRETERRSSLKISEQPTATETAVE